MRVIGKQEWEKRNRNRKGEKVLRTCKENILPSENEYKKLVEKKTPNSKKIAGFLKAFWVGGVICVIGYYVNMLGSAIGFSEKNLPMFTASVLVYLGTLLTGVGIYDKIGKYAGAGSIVPITGFANSVCAPAMEFRREGVITGIGAKLFTIAGPVLTYGISASVVYGFIYWIKEYLLK
ncbi:MAG: SpoVA/SpoVAEb family sporulation membrane protein [Clostridia bacterium]|nr:SpoVA/SpoVAEb family sporulation membrane protein [Clostridia bacterium]